MPTLVNPTAEQLSTLVRDEVALANMKKHTPRRMLDAATVATAVVHATHGLKKPAGALDTNGGTNASSYPAKTVAVAVAWFTRDNGDLVVRVRAKAIQLKSENSPVDAPYAPDADVAEGLIAAGAYPVLVSDELRRVYQALKGYADPLSQAVYGNPGDMTAWMAFADWCDEQGSDGPKAAAIIRKVIGGQKVQQ